MARRLTKKQAAPKAGADNRLYTLDVFIIIGESPPQYVDWDEEEEEE